MRLLKVGEVRFLKSGHGQREDEAKRGVGHIHVAYDHYNFSKGIRDWVEKHNRYSTEEAETLLENPISRISLRNLLSGAPIERQRRLKQLHAKMPGRWMVKFLYLYF